MRVMMREWDTGVNVQGAKGGVRSHDSREFRKPGSHSKSVEDVQYHMEDAKNDCILNHIPSVQKHEIRIGMCQIMEKYEYTVYIYI